MSNPFVHFELNTTDTKKAQAFYKKLFDWKFASMPMGGPEPYIMVDSGQKGLGGGITKKPMAEAPTQWLIYVQVDSVKKTIAKAKKLGATIYVEYMPIPGMGAFGIFGDPTGAGLGVWERSAAPPAKKGGAKKGATKKGATKKGATKKGAAKTGAKKR
jgi:hypothetical protein